MDASLGTPAAPWSLVVGHLGHAAVLGALAAFVTAIVLAAGSAKRPEWTPWSGRAAWLGGAAVATAFACLLALFVRDQFQFAYVFKHGALDHELRYKIAGVWSGQQGSILLWASTTALFGLLALRGTGGYRRWYTVVFGAVMTGITSILVFESPFVLRAPVDGQFLVPTTGQGMAPSLLNYWVTIHPPTIFLGFGSLVVLYCWAMAAMLQRDMVGWVPGVRPWVLVSTTLVGLGLTMGGFWAYETLGWGGFWMWDPVENVSFVPWCLTAALIHGAFVQQARRKWFFTNAFLACMPFVAFVYGTFLTRSGFLGDTSVHSFASMDRNALWTLVSLMAATLFGFLGVWAVRRVQMRGQLPAPIMAEPTGLHRESFFAVGSWLLAAFAIVTAIGMSVPLIQSLAGQQPKVVEEQLYNTVLAFFFVPLVLAMAVGPFVTWRGLGFRALVVRMLNVLAVSIGLTGFTLLWAKGDWMGMTADAAATATLLLRWEVNQLAWVMSLTWLCWFGVVASGWRLAETFGQVKGSVGGMLTHLGVLTAVFGLVFSRGLQQKEQLLLTSHNSVKAFGYDWLAQGPTKTYADRDNKVKVLVSNPLARFEMWPGLYYLGTDEAGEPRPFIWPGIRNQPLYDLYLVVHGLTFDASDPTDMKVGETRLLPTERMLVTYNGYRTEGTPGMAGAKFVADVTVDTVNGRLTTQPAIKLGASGIEDLPADLGDHHRVRLVKIDAATKGATLQVLYKEPAYPVEVFYKPFTVLVWGGVGIMTIGGFLAAWGRRTSRRTPPAAPTTEAKGEPGAADHDDAPVPAAQV